MVAGGEVRRAVERVVVVVEEVPSGDVVRVAVVVVVELPACGADAEVVVRDLAVPERLDQVLTGDLAARSLRDVRDARVVLEVVDVDHAVAVEVEAAERGVRVGVTGRVLRQRQLAGVEVDLVAQASAVPPDARVEDRDRGPAVATGELPGAGCVVAGDLRHPEVWPGRIEVPGARRRVEGREPEEV